MSIQWPKAGANDVPAYTLPGIPWVTGSLWVSGSSAVELTLPCASNEVIVRHLSGATNASIPAPKITVGFTRLGMSTVNHNYLTIDGGTEIKMNVRVKTLFISATNGTPSWEVLACLSMVSNDSFPVITGSISGSDGILRPAIFSGVG